MGDVIHINLDDDEKKTSKPKKKQESQPEQEPKEVGVIKTMEDLDSIVGDFEAACKETAKYIDAVTRGTGYGAAQDAVGRLADRLMSYDNTMSFFSKYAFLRDPKKKEEFLNTEDAAGPSYAVREGITVFFKTMYKASVFRSRLCAFLKEYVQNPMAIPYSAIRYKEKMTYMFSDADMEALVQAFAEFDYVCSIYEGTSYSDYAMVIDEATFSVEEAQEQILKLMGNDIKKQDTLCNLLNDAKSLAYYGKNILDNYDKASKEFRESHWYYRVDMEKTKSQLLKLEEEIWELIKQVGTYEHRFDGYYEGMKNVLFSVKTLFQNGLNAVDDFLEKENEAPYRLIHPNSRIAGYVSKHHLAPYKDVRREGTNYVEMFSSMLARFREIALSVAQRN